MLQTSASRDHESGGRGLPQCCRLFRHHAWSNVDTSSFIRLDGKHHCITIVRSCQRCCPEATLALSGLCYRLMPCWNVKLCSKKFDQYFLQNVSVQWSVHLFFYLQKPPSSSCWKTSLQNDALTTMLHCRDRIGGFRLFINSTIKAWLMEFCRDCCPSGRFYSTEPLVLWEFYAFSLDGWLRTQSCLRGL